MKFVRYQVDLVFEIDTDNENEAVEVALGQVERLERAGTILGISASGKLRNIVLDYGQFDDGGVEILDTFE